MRAPVNLRVQDVPDVTHTYSNTPASAGILHPSYRQAETPWRYRCFVLPRRGRCPEGTEGGMVQDGAPNRDHRSRKRDRAPALMGRPIGGVRDADCREIEQISRGKTKA